MEYSEMNKCSYNYVHGFCVVLNYAVQCEWSILRRCVKQRCGSFASTKIYINKYYACFVGAIIKQYTIFAANKLTWFFLLNFILG